MGKVIVYPGGSTASFPSGSSHTRAKRGVVNGWTPEAARRLLKFLWSVDADALTGTGYAVTVTMGGMPETADDWARARKALYDWMRARGIERWQWLTEWTAQQRPHMHMCVYSDGFDERELALAWIEICRREGWPAEWKGQHVERVYDSTGWLKYVAKHSARGVDHYQRETPPDGWEVTGRLWGKGGDWPVHEPYIVDLTAGQTFQYMGHFKSWQAERMRAEGVEAEIIEQYLSREAVPRNGGVLRGLSGWIPAVESAKLLLLVTESPDWRRNEIEP